MDILELQKELGPMKYHFKTRIGNWSEEWELEEYKLSNFSCYLFY